MLSSISGALHACSMRYTFRHHVVHHMMLSSRCKHNVSSVLTWKNSSSSMAWVLIVILKAQSSRAHVHPTISTHQPWGSGLVHLLNSTTSVNACPESCRGSKPNSINSCEPSSVCFEHSQLQTHQIAQFFCQSSTASGLQFSRRGFMEAFWRSGSCEYRSNSTAEARPMADPWVSVVIIIRNVSCQHTHL